MWAMTAEAAGWWSRVGATLIDSLVGVAAFAVLFGIAALLDAAGVPTLLFLPFSVGGILALWVIPAIWMARTNGRTIGKRAAGIRVVRVSGAPTTLGWSLLREVLVKGVLSLLIVLDPLWALWDRENRTLHDIVAGSRVLRERPEVAV